MLRKYVKIYKQTYIAAELRKTQITFLTIVITKNLWKIFFLPKPPKDNVKTALPHSPRIIDVQGISSKITIETPSKYNLKRDVKASSPSSDEVININ